MAVSPRCPVILGFNYMKYCNPPGLNLILPQLVKSSGLHRYQSFSLHSSLWSCPPCKLSLGSCGGWSVWCRGLCCWLWLQCWLLPLLPFVLYSRTAAVGVCFFHLVLVVTPQSGSGWITHVNETPEIKVMSAKRYKFLGHSVLWLLSVIACIQVVFSSVVWCVVGKLTPQALISSNICRT